MESLHLRNADHLMERSFSTQASLSQAFRPLLRFGNRRTRLTVESILLVLAVVFAAVWFSAPYFARGYINRNLSYPINFISSSWAWWAGRPGRTWFQAKRAATVPA